MKKIRKMKKKICITLAVCLFASCPVAVMAAESQVSSNVSVIESGNLETTNVSVQAINRSRIVFSRQSDAVGIGSVYFTSDRLPSHLKATIILQQAEKKSNTYRNSTQAAVTVIVRNNRTLSKDFRFTISTTKKYRVKVVVKETVNGSVSMKTYYRNLK